MIAALGDLVEDIVVRLGGPINDASDTAATIVRRRGGSAANVAAGVARLGGASRFLGQVGADATGVALTDELAREGVDVTSVRREGSTGTIVALVDPSGERSMLTDRRACADLDRPDPAWLDDVSMLHVPFYSLAGGALAATAATLVGWAHERGVAVSIDASSHAVLRAFGRAEARTRIETLAPALLFANADEAAELDITGPVAGALTVIKHGASPTVVHLPDGSTFVVPAIRIAAPVDTTGAGDAFAAGFLTALDRRDDPDAACVAAHRAAAALLTTRP